ncbi:DUF2795 domain-containing protein [Uniformispora flossi]|uniref:DUF2795 domain-containing protein n=1 Tax=Uniformispora flossi TaxID=3390723 RepID=UPI003C2E994E
MTPSHPLPVDPIADFAPHGSADLTAADLHDALIGAVYPARPAELAALAVRNHAAPRLAEALAALPDRPIVGPNQLRVTILGPDA